MPDTFSIRLPDELRAEVDRLAKSQNRSRAFIIKEAVEVYVADQQAYQRAVEDALSEADKGIFISGDKAFAWLDQLRTDPDAPHPRSGRFQKMSLVLLPLAAQDIAKTAAYLKRANPHAVEPFRQAFVKSLRLIDANPWIGHHSRSEGVREWSIPDWPYLIP